MKFLKDWYNSLDSDIKIFSIIYSIVILIALFVKVEVSEYIALVATYSVIIFTIISPLYFIFKKKIVISLFYVFFAIIFTYYFHIYYVFL